MDGNWTGWLSWSGCYDVDGTGQKTRQRLCLDPRPSNGGTDCVGIDTEQMECEGELQLFTLQKLTYVTYCYFYVCKNHVKTKKV